MELLPDESQRVINHSPDGFSWGYEGTGPAQLALAILLFFMPREEAERHHQEFKRLLVSHLPMDSFEIDIDPKRIATRLRNRKETI